MSLVLEFLRLVTPAQAAEIAHDPYALAIRAERANHAERADPTAPTPDLVAATLAAPPAAGRPPAVNVAADDALEHLLGGPGALAVAIAVAVTEALERYRAAAGLGADAVRAIEDAVRRHVYQALIAHHVMLAGAEPARRQAANAYWADLVERAGAEEDAYAGALACAAADACRSALGTEHADRDAMLASCELGARRAIASWLAVLAGDDAQPLWDLHWLMARAPGRWAPPDVDRSFALFIGHSRHAACAPLDGAANTASCTTSP